MLLSVFQGRQHDLVCNWMEHSTLNGLRLLCLLFALLGSLGAVGVYAEDLPPDPSLLEAAWWDYFVPDAEDPPELIGQRIETATARLTVLREQFLADQKTSLVALTDAVISNLVRYQKFSQAPLPVPELALPAQESYTLEEIRELIEALRKAGVEYAEESQEIDLLERAIAAGQRGLNQLKVDYRALDVASPKRTRRGLELMQSRLQLELGKRELAWRRAKNASKSNEIDNLQGLVESAAQRLTASAEAIESAALKRAEAEQAAEALRIKLLKAQLAQSGALALTPDEQARDKLAAQRLVALDVQATQQEIVGAQSSIVERILTRIRAENNADPGADRDYLRSYQQQLEQVQSKLVDWRASTSRSRETALARIPDEGDQNLAELLKLRAEMAVSTETDLRDIEEQLIRARQFGDLLDSLLRTRESTMSRGLQVAEDLADLSWVQVNEWVSTSLFEVGGAPVTALDIFRMVIILTIAWWLSKLLRGALQRIAAKRKTVNTGSIYTLSRILHYAILSIGLMIALSSIGIDFTKFALFASALGVGIGFGLQTLVSNFVAGLIILFEKSLKIGDFVELESGVTGEVREINMRSTLVTTNDNIDIVVPNSEFVNSRVTNWTMREAYRRIHIPFGVAYGTDKELVRKAALEAASEVPLTLTGNTQRTAQLWFVEFGDSSLNFELVVWLNPDAVKRPGAVQARYLWEIDDMLRKYEIEVPFPQRDLHLRSGFGAIGSETPP